MVHQVLEGDPGYDEVRQRMGEMRINFSCGRVEQASSCVIWEDGVAVVVLFSIPEGITGRISSPSMGGWLDVDLEPGTALAVPHEGGRFSVIYMRDGA